VPRRQGGGLHCLLPLPRRARLLPPLVPGVVTPARGAEAGGVRPVRSPDPRVRRVSCSPRLKGRRPRPDQAHRVPRAMAPLLRGMLADVPVHWLRVTGVQSAPLLRQWESTKNRKGGHDEPATCDPAPADRGPAAPPRQPRSPLGGLPWRRGPAPAGADLARLRPDGVPAAASMGLQDRAAACRPAAPATAPGGAKPARDPRLVRGGARARPPGLDLRVEHGPQRPQEREPWRGDLLRRGPRPWRLPPRRLPRAGLLAAGARCGGGASPDAVPVPPRRAGPRPGGAVSAGADRPG